MKPGQLFDLPVIVCLLPGHIGIVKDNEGNSVAKYEVIKTDDGELKCRILVTYRNKRRRK